MDGATSPSAPADLGSPAEARTLAPGERILLASILLLLAAVWIEPKGSSLAEPDEPRYAEIPREMLATRDFVTPHLNGVPYFEKPPLLYWANAASLAVLGETPFAARLSTRLAGLGTTLLLFLWVRRVYGRTSGLAAAALFLASPLPFTFSRLNLTDGPLTFFFTATLFAGWKTLESRRRGRPTAGLSALAGALAAAGFLTKGLIAIVLPGAILVSWAFATRRWRSLSSLLFGPALPVFLALSVPWFALAERAHPGVLRFFFVFQHFQRFATNAASRPGPIYYFIVVFVAGFLPALPFFFAGLRRIRREEPETLLFVLWFWLVFVFFTLSRSKLSPYLFPAFPAAGALAARGLVRGGGSARWWASGVIATGLLAATVAIPDVREAVAAQNLKGVALAGALALLAGAWGSLIDRRRPISAAGTLAAGWAGLYLALAFLWPHTPNATDLPRLARTAGAISRAAGAQVASYRTFVQTFPWELKRAVPLVDHVGELEPWFLPENRRPEIFWSGQTFWDSWRTRPMVAVVPLDRRGDFDRAIPPAIQVGTGGRYCLLTNVDEKLLGGVPR